MNHANNIPSSVSPVIDAPAFVPTEEVGKRVQEKLQRAQTDINMAVRQFLNAPDDAAAAAISRLLAEYAGLSANVRALLA